VIDPPVHVDRRTTWRTEALTLLPMLLVAAAAFEFAARSDAGHLPLVRAGLAVLVTQLLPGILLWRALRPPEGLLVEDLVLGTACGAALAVVAQVAAVASGLMVLAWLVPLSVALALLLVPAIRGRILRASWRPLPWWWGTAMVVPLIMAVRVSTSVFNQPMSGGGGWIRQYVDLPYHLSLVAELAHRFPPHSPQTADQPLAYHWFSHAAQAQIGGVSGTELDVVLFRFAPLLVGLAVTVAIGTTALRFVRVPAAGPLAALASLCVATIGFWGLSASGARQPFNPLSPSLGFSSLVLCPLLVLLVTRWRGEAPGWTAVGVLPLAVIAGGAKGSVDPVVLVGCLVACLAAFVTQHRNRWMVVLDTVAVGAALVFLVSIVFAGNEGAMRLTPFTSLEQLRGSQILPEGSQPGPWGVALVVVLLALALILPFAGLFGGLWSRRTAMDPAFWLLAGAGAAGMGAVLVLHHVGAAQVYFLNSDSPMLAIGLAWGLIRLASRARRWWLGATAGALVGGLMIPLLLALLPARGPHAILSATVEVAVFLLVVGLAATVVWRVGRHDVAAGVLCACVAFAASASLLGFLRLAEADFGGTALPAGPDEADSISTGQILAARFLRKHSDPDDVVMTNRHCRVRNPTVCDNRRFSVAAYSERRVLVEGWGYTRRANEGGNGAPGYNPLSAPFWDPELLRLNDDFIRSPTAAAQRRLYALGVRWVFVDRTSGPRIQNLSPYAALRFENRTAAVYRLLKPGS